jgi:hypothetical protein
VSDLAAALLEPTALAGAEGADPRALIADLADVSQPEGLFTVDQRLAALCRERGPLRAVLSRIAWHLVVFRAWERIGYRSLSDYAVERLGLSARWVRSLALVGDAFRRFPSLEGALASGTLGWTKVRLLASLPGGEDEAEWIARARRLTAEQLSKRVRAVDRGSVEAGALEDETTCRSRLFETRCSPDVRWKWYAAMGAASRAAGRMLHVAEAAEFVAAEVLSALPVDESWEQEACEQTPALSNASDEEDAAAARADAAPRVSSWQGYGALEALLVGLEDADAFALDERLRRALSIEQRLDAGVGPLLARLWDRWAHRLLGYRTREAYARERLGMDPTRARALVRLERAAVVSEPFARAYRSGALSWVKAGLLVPLVSADPLGRFMEEWVAWAGQVTVRRLRQDVEWALALEDTDPAAFRQSGGLPADREIRAPRTNPGKDMVPGADREIGAPRTNPGEDTVPGADREIGAPRTAPADVQGAETCTVRFIGPAEVVQLFRAVVCTVRRRMEMDAGRLPTEGQALGVILDYVFSCWGVGDKVAARHRVFERDGWLCAAPGCTSMQNLQDHHIVFRSAGGSNGPENRVALCAWHHLRGIHAERLRCTGRAPDGLTWQMGIRPGAAPLVTYVSGDREIR